MQPKTNVRQPGKLINLSKMRDFKEPSESGTRNVVSRTKSGAFSSDRPEFSDMSDIREHIVGNLDELGKDMPFKERYLPEITSPDEDLLLSKYKSKFRFMHLIDSFDRFLGAKPNEGELATIFESIKIPLSIGKYANIQITKIDKPEHSREQCRLEGLTYECSIIGRVVIWENGKVVGKSSHTVIMKMPIMEYSRYCLSRKEIEENRNPEYPGCCLILNGERYVIMLYEKLRQNQYMLGIDKNSPAGGFYVSHVSETESSTSKIASYVVPDPSVSKTGGIISISLRHYLLWRGGPWKENTTKEDNTEEKEESPKKQDKKKKDKIRVNILAVVFAILRISEDEDIIEDWMTIREKKELAEESKKKAKKLANLNREKALNYFISLLKQYIPQDRYFKCYEEFILTINDYNEHSYDNLIEMVYEKMQLISSEKGNAISEALQDEYFREYVEHDIFPTAKTSKDKINSIAVMISYHLQCISGYISITNKNHWGHNGLHPPGRFFYNVLKSKYPSLIRILKTVTKTNPEGIPEDISPDKLAGLISKGLSNSGGLTVMFFEGLRLIKPKPGKNKLAKENKKPKAGDKAAILLNVSPLNNLDLSMMLCKTTNDAIPENKNFETKALRGEFVKFLCSLAITENERCGMTKFIASTTIITLNEDPSNLIKFLEKGHKFKHEGKRYKLKIISREYIRRRKPEEGFTLPVTVNGIPIGFVNELFGYATIIEIKRTVSEFNKICVVKSPSGILEIYTDGQRLMIPAVVMSDDENDTRVPCLNFVDNWRDMSLDELVSQGYIEYIDNYETENPQINFAQTFASSKNYEIEKRRLEERLLHDEGEVYMNNVNYELSTMEKGKFSHVAIHPSGAYSIVLSLVPYNNSVQTCRTAFAAKTFICQAQGKPFGTKFEHSSGFGTTTTVAISRPSLYDIQKLSNQISGQTVCIAFLATYENQEDACIVNKAFIDRGGGRYRRTLVFKSEIEKEQEQYFVRPSTGAKNPYIMRNINENGTPTPGTYVGPGDAIIGKVQKMVGQNGEKYLKDLSTYLERDECGVVTEVVTHISKKTKTGGEKRTMSVRIDAYSVLTAGDKISSRHSQKHIVSQVVPKEDMPWGDGVPQIDYAFSPFCYITRMTLGTLLEPFIGKATSIDGRMRDMASHKETNITDVKEVLLKSGFSDKGMHNLYSGRTGEPIRAQIFTGFTRIAMLSHIGKEKMQCRAMGRKNTTTFQAQGSKYGDAKTKGQKIGLFERNNLVQYGANFLIQERTNLSCDGVKVVVCLICSNYASFNPSILKYECSNCGSAKEGKASTMFGKYIIPQTTMYVRAGLMSLGINLKSKYVSSKEFMSGRTDEANDEMVHDNVDDDEYADIDED